MKRFLQITVVAACLVFSNLSIAVPTMTRDSLIYYLSNPMYATASRYNLLDSAGNQMQTPSVIDLVGQTYKYAAVYHTPYAVTGGWRYKINLAKSNDLINWTYVRMLVDNADMPKITKVTNGAWIVLTHEQWLGSGQPSTLPCRIGFKLFYDSTDLMNGTIRSTWTAGQYQSTLNGTPNFYDAHLALYNGYYAVDATVGFHYWNGTRDVVANSTVVKLFLPQGGTTWYPSTPTAYNNLFINAGVTGNIGQREKLVISAGGFNVQEGNIGTPAGSWDKWRIWLYTFGDSYIYPTGTGTVLQLAPQTPNGSISFGNPSVSFVTRTSGTGQAMVVSYFIFSEGSGLGEPGSLIYYFNI